MTYERALYFRCAESVASHIENVINSSYEPKITFFIASRPIPGEITTFKLTPVLLAITGFIAIDRAQHRRPRSANDQLPANIWPDFVTFFIDDGWIDAKERKCCAARLGGSRAGQRRNQNRTSLSLPPRINNRTSPATNRFMIPHPSLWIDRFTHGAEQPQ